MPATINDIKQRTGLSLGTISKYLNGGSVRPKNQEKIEEAIKSLHYEVNELARGLVTNRTKTVGVVVYSIESLFNGTLLRYIGEKLRKKGYAMLICDCSDDSAVQKKNIRFLLSKKVDGILVIPVGHADDFLIPAKEANVPVVLLDRVLQGGSYSCVRIDNRGAASRGTNFLLENGHQKIAVISSACEYTGMERYEGFMEAMRRAGLEVPESYQKRGVHSIEFGHQSMRELLELPERPTAVFMTNYEITLGAVMAVNESVYHCPKDISMVGFDNLLLSNLVEPRIYTVVQPMREMAERATELLLRQLEHGDEFVQEEVILGTRIEAGNSVLKLK